MLLAIIEGVAALLMRCFCEFSVRGLLVPCLVCASTLRSAEVKSAEHACRKLGAAGTALYMRVIQAQVTIKDTKGDAHGADGTGEANEGLHKCSAFLNLMKLSHACEDNGGWPSWVRSPMSPSPQPQA